MEQIFHSVPSVRWARTIFFERLGEGGGWPSIGKIEFGDRRVINVKKVSRPAPGHPLVCPMGNKKAYASRCLGVSLLVPLLEIHMRSSEKP